MLLGFVFPLCPLVFKGWCAEKLQRQSCRSHRVCLFAAGRGCMFPAGCWPVSAETSQKDDFPGTPRSKTHNRQRRCRQHRSIKANQQKPVRWSIDGQTNECRVQRFCSLKSIISAWLTGLSLQSSLRTSGAIQPSVPGTPDLLLKLWRPTASFLHKPKSEIMARTLPWALGIDTSMLWGFRSLWTTKTETEKRALGRLLLLIKNTEILYPGMDTYVKRVQMGQARHGLLKQHHRFQPVTLKVLPFHVLDGLKRERNGT